MTRPMTRAEGYTSSELLAVMASRLLEEAKRPVENGRVEPTDRSARRGVLQQHGDASAVADVARAVPQAPIEEHRFAFLRLELQDAAARIALARPRLDLAIGGLAAPPVVASGHPLERLAEAMRARYDRERRLARDVLEPEPHRDG